LTARTADPAALRYLLEPRSIALVGASARPGSFGERMVGEVLRSPAEPTVHLINPRYDEIDGRPCLPSLADVEGPVDVVLLGVGDAALEEQMWLAAGRGDRSAVIFGNAYEPPVLGVASLRKRLAAIAEAASMQVCGAGCMGFVNVVHGVRAIGYVEPDPLPPGPVALVTHSGSVFSALLRARRGFGFTLAVSSGQELVTTTPAYLDYALSLPQTAVVALVLEAMRDAPALRAALERAAQRDVPVVILPVGTSEHGRAMVAAHSGAVAGGTAGWEALADAYGAHLVGDIGELLDTVEVFAAGKRARRARAHGCGIAAVLDSGAERALMVDLAAACGVPFAMISAETTETLVGALDPGLVATNPLDVWGTGAATEQLFGDVLLTMAADPAVRAVALAVDFVEELDDDESYPDALLRVAGGTDLPVVGLSHTPSALDPQVAARLRAGGVPVLEGTRSGLRALAHLLAHQPRFGPVAAVPIDEERRSRWLARLASEALDGVEAFDLLADYGIRCAAVRAAGDEQSAAEEASRIGYPVVLKTGEPIVHKTEARGVVLGVRDEGSLRDAYRDLAARLGKRVVLAEQVAPGTEVLVGVVRDPALGPIVVVGAGGVLVELVADRVAALPPVDHSGAIAMIARTAVYDLLCTPRGAQPADLDALASIVVGMSHLAVELNEAIEAVELNPVVCSASGAVAVDVVVESSGAGTG
jgi:acyl-CoA synthetase (NDP forming)